MRGFWRQQCERQANQIDERSDHYGGRIGARKANQRANRRGSDRPQDAAQAKSETGAKCAMSARKKLRQPDGIESKHAVRKESERGQKRQEQP